jgi:hypothetical protein
MATFLVSQLFFEIAFQNPSVLRSVSKDIPSGPKVLYISLSILKMMNANLEKDGVARI